MLTSIAGIATMLCPPAYASQWWPGNFPALVAALLVGWLLFLAFVMVTGTDRNKPAPAAPSTTHLLPGHQPSPDDLTINWGQLTSRLPVDDAERIALDLLNQVRAARTRAAAAAADAGMAAQ
ncbi:hypothetical protein [Nonomuraea sp. NPDC050202]|uniref:hypothetical protein n=1 Tax=Nonomuraea sp. NPDC050202 TaxID=3155035 RepID=UPI0033C85D5C